jgi:hypothetical protein
MQPSASSPRRPNLQIHVHGIDTPLFSYSMIAGGTFYSIRCTTKWLKEMEKGPQPFDDHECPEEDQVKLQRLS